MDLLRRHMFDSVRKYCFPDIQLGYTFECYTEDPPLSLFGKYGLLAEKLGQEQQVNHSPYGHYSRRSLAFW
jgi:hypothetical protein